jgi:hypothetical protein
MVNADGTIAGDSAAPCGARMAAKQSVAGPRNEAPQVKGKGPSVSLVSEVSGLLSPEWNPFIIFFPFQIDVFFSKFE